MSKKRIVVVDDDKPVLETIRMALDAKGYEVCAVSNVMDAHQYLFSAKKPSLIILDVIMSVLDGKVAALIFKQSSRCGDVPILLISGKPAAELEVLVALTGASGYVAKPFTVQELLLTVARHIL